MFFKLLLVFSLLAYHPTLPDGTSVQHKVPSAFHIRKLSGFTHYGIREKTDSVWIVLHDDNGTSVQAAFQTLRARRESYHYYISRTGNVYQLVDTKWQAKHAGDTFYDGLDHWNKFSIGICLENDEEQEYTNVQYIKLNELLILLQNKYPTISKSHIVSHAMIAYPRGRKGDVSALFDWNRVFVPLDN